MSEDRPWHDDDAFWRTYRPWLFSLERWERAPGQVERLLELLEPPEGAHVLDLCCGPGRHSLELARRGFRVTGVDRTEEYLEEARRRAGEEGLDVEFVRADMRKFVRKATFDAAVNLFTSFGYFEDPADDRAVLRNVRDSLRPGGRLLMDLAGKEVLARDFRVRDWSEIGDTILLQERRLSDGWSWIENRWVLVRDGQREEFNVSHRLYSGAELRQLLRECGFDQVRILGGLDRREYDHEARRLVTLARVPGNG